MDDQTYTLSDQDINTILAALRFYQAEDMGDPAKRPDEIHQIATNNGEDISMDDAGIDDLCKRLDYWTVNASAAKRIKEGS